MGQESYILIWEYDKLFFNYTITFIFLLLFFIYYFKTLKIFLEILKLNQTYFYICQTITFSTTIFLGMRLSRMQNIYVKQMPPKEHGLMVVFGMLR